MMICVNLRVLSSPIFGLVHSIPALNLRHAGRPLRQVPLELSCAGTKPLGALGLQITCSPKALALCLKPLSLSLKSRPLSLKPRAFGQKFRAPRLDRSGAVLEPCNAKAHAIEEPVRARSTALGLTWMRGAAARASVALRCWVGPCRLTVGARRSLRIAFACKAKVQWNDVHRLGTDSGARLRSLVTRSATSPPLGLRRLSGSFYHFSIIGVGIRKTHLEQGCSSSGVQREGNSHTEGPRHRVGHRAHTYGKLCMDPCHRSTDHRRRGSSHPVHASKQRLYAP